MLAGFFFSIGYYIEVACVALLVCVVVHGEFYFNVS
jgi:hypothetical protein